MDKIKEAFEKVAEDIGFLSNELSFLRQDIIQLNQQIIEINKKINKKPIEINSTHNHITPTSSTHASTHNLFLEASNTKNILFSTGNQGVSTNKQTNKPTNQHTNISQNSIENVSEILDSLDNIKKEIRLKFKRLTEQEWFVFSTLYQLEEEQEFVDYKTLSQRLNLTESSIRGYVGRLIKKGIPIDKKRINNKNIQISISSNLKKIASLNTILHLRDL